MKTLVISDVHNRLDRLNAALGHAGCRKDDRLIFLGDMMDAFTGAAAETIKTLDYLSSLAKDSRHVFIRGNHEEEMLMAIEGKSRIVASALVFALTEEHRSFLRSTQETYEEGGYIFVHDWTLQLVPGKTVISGHWHNPAPLAKQGLIVMADDDRVFAMDLETKRIWGSEGEVWDV